MWLRYKKETWVGLISSHYVLFLSFLVHGLGHPEKVFTCTDLLRFSRFSSLFHPIYAIRSPLLLKATVDYLHLIKKSVMAAGKTVGLSTPLSTNSAANLICNSVGYQSLMCLTLRPVGYFNLLNVQATLHFYFRTPSCNILVFDGFYRRIAGE